MADHEARHECEKLRRLVADLTNRVEALSGRMDDFTGRLWTLEAASKLAREESGCAAGCKRSPGHRGFCMPLAPTAPADKAPPAEAVRRPKVGDAIEVSAGDRWWPTKVALVGKWGFGIETGYVYDYDETTWRWPTTGGDTP